MLHAVLCCWFAGEEPHSGIVASISSDNPALVTCVDDERLEFQVSSSSSTLTAAARCAPAAVVLAAAAAMLQHSSRSRSSS